VIVDRDDAGNLHERTFQAITRASLAPSII